MVAVLVYRGSASKPEEKFRDGFQPRHAQAEGIKIQKGGQMIGGVSTAKELGPAVRYAASYEGYVYCAYLTDGIDVLDYILKRSEAWFGGDSWKGGIENARTQAEIAAPSIPGVQIIAARQAVIEGSMAKLSGKLFLNWTTATTPNSVPMAQAMEAIRIMSADFEVSKEYEH